MNFVKGMAAGIAVGAALSMALLPKPKHYACRMRKSANKAAHSLGELVDSIVSVIC